MDPRPDHLVLPGWTHFWLPRVLLEVLHDSRPQLYSRAGRGLDYLTVSSNQKRTWQSAYRITVSYRFGILKTRERIAALRPDISDAVIVADNTHSYHNSALRLESIVHDLHARKIRDAAASGVRPPIQNYNLASIVLQRMLNAVNIGQNKQGGIRPSRFWRSRSPPLLV